MSKECFASGRECSFGPHGPNGSMQCRWCGESKPKFTRSVDLERPGPVCATHGINSLHMDCPICRWTLDARCEIKDALSNNESALKLLTLIEAQTTIAACKALAAVATDLLQHTR